MAFCCGSLLKHWLLAAPLKLPLLLHSLRKWAFCQCPAVCACAFVYGEPLVGSRILRRLPPSALPKPLPPDSADLDLLATGATATGQGIKQAAGCRSVHIAASPCMAQPSRWPSGPIWFEIALSCGAHSCGQTAAATVRGRKETAGKLCILL